MSLFSQCLVSDRATAAAPRTLTLPKSILKALPIAPLKPFRGERRVEEAVGVGKIVKTIVEENFVIIYAGKIIVKIIEETLITTHK